MISKLLGSIALVFGLTLALPSHAEEAAVAEEFFVPVEWCDQLESIGFPVGWCYPNVSINATPTGITTASATVSGTTTRDYGTMYLYGTTSCVTPPSVDDIVSNNGSIAFQQFPVSGTSFTKSITGIPPTTTNMCVYAVHEWERRYSPPVKTNTFSLLPSSSNPKRYVSCTGSDSNNGTSDAQAWLTLNKAQQTITEDSTILFLKASCVWEDQTITVGWHGTSELSGGITGYKMVGGVETPLTTDDDVSIWPEINGTLEAACRATGTCALNTAAAVPSSIYASLVRASQSNFFVSFVKMLDSAGQWVGANALQAPGGRIDNLVFEHTYQRYAAFAGVVWEKGVHNSAWRFNNSENAATCERHQQLGLPLFNNGNPLGNCNAPARPSCIKIGIQITSPGYNLVEGNYLGNCPGEGFGVGSQSHAIYQDNFIYNAASGIYLDHARNIVVQRNFLWSTASSDQWWITAGLAFGAEGAYANIGPNNAQGRRGSEFNVIRDNIVVGQDLLFYNSNISNNAVTAGVNSIDDIFTQNTGINLNLGPGVSSPGFYLRSDGAKAASIVNLDVVGNIIHSFDANQSVCNITNPNFSKFFAYNYFSKEPTQAACKGSGDVYGGMTLPHDQAWYDAMPEGEALLSSFDKNDYIPTNSVTKNKVLNVLDWDKPWLVAMRNDSNWDFTIARSLGGQAPFACGPFEGFDENYIDFSCAPKVYPLDMGALQDN